MFSVVDLNWLLYGMDGKYIQENDCSRSQWGEKWLFKVS